MPGNAPCELSTCARAQGPLDECTQ